MQQQEPIHDDEFYESLAIDRPGSTYIDDAPGDSLDYETKSRNTAIATLVLVAIAVAILGTLLVVGLRSSGLSSIRNSSSSNLEL